MSQSMIEDTSMAKKTTARGRSKTAKKAAPKTKKVRRIAKAAKKVRKSIRAKATKAPPNVAKARTQAQIKNEGARSMSFNKATRCSRIIPAQYQNILDFDDHHTPADGQQHRRHAAARIPAGH